MQFSIPFQEFRFLSFLQLFYVGSLIGCFIIFFFGIDLIFNGFKLDNDNLDYSTKWSPLDVLIVFSWNKNWLVFLYPRITKDYNK